MKPQRIRFITAFILSSVLTAGSCLGQRIEDLEPYSSEEVNICRLLLSVRTVVYTPKGQTAKANLFYTPGFGDVVDNHLNPTIKMYLEHGYRVISLDYPSTGKTRGLRPLGSFTMNGLGALAEQALIRHADRSLKLVVAGWSTGGLLALRMLERRQFAGMEPAGLLLYTPAVSVPFFVGEGGFVTPRSLSSNSDADQYSVKPRSPFFHPFFALSLLRNARQAEKMELPPNLPTAVILADEDLDKYINTARVRAWATRQRDRNSALIFTHVFPGRRHMIDTEKVGNTASLVGTISTNFLDGVVSGLIRRGAASPSEYVYELR